jgi:hypothetical protein
MSVRMGFLAGLVVFAAGCATAALKHQAALDHGCTEDRITVGRAPDDPGLPTEVNVCGTVRRYRMISSADTWTPVWLDVTDLVPAPSKRSDK